MYGLLALSRRKSFSYGRKIRHYERRYKFQVNRDVPRRAELILDVVLFENGRKPLPPTSYDGYDRDFIPSPGNHHKIIRSSVSAVDVVGFCFDKTIRTTSISHDIPPYTYGTATGPPVNCKKKQLKNS